MGAFDTDPDTDPDPDPDSINIRIAASGHLILPDNPKPIIKDKCMSKTAANQAGMFDCSSSNYGS